MVARYVSLMVRRNLESQVGIRSEVRVEAVVQAVRQRDCRLFSERLHEEWFSETLVSPIFTACLFTM